MCLEVQEKYFVLTPNSLWGVVQAQNKKQAIVTQFKCQSVAQAVRQNLTIEISKEQDAEVELQCVTSEMQKSLQ